MTFEGLLGYEKAVADSVVSEVGRFVIGFVVVPHAFLCELVSVEDAKREVAGAFGVEAEDVDFRFGVHEASYAALKLVRITCGSVMERLASPR